MLAISQITEIINKINELQSLNSNMVDQQTKATQQISSNVTEATSGINEIARSINESADGVNRVSRGISEIATGAGEVAQNIAEAAVGVTDQNEKLTEISVMVTEANRYTKRTSDASGVSKTTMEEMLVAVDRVADAVNELETVCRDRMEAEGTVVESQPQ